jgi:hypothetical protein
MIKRSFHIRAATEEKVQRFLAIAGDEDGIRQLLPAQRVQSEIYVVLIVFHQQDVEFP